jgi:cold shock CspA family protein
MFSNTSFGQLRAYMRKLETSPKREKPKNKESRMYLEGTIRAYMEMRGYGFLTPDENADQSVFFHRRNAIPTLVRAPWKKGMRVRYELIDSRSPGKPQEARIVEIMESVQ